MKLVEGQYYQALFVKTKFYTLQPTMLLCFCWMSQWIRMSSLCACVKKEIRSGLREQNCATWFCLIARDWCSGPLRWTLGRCQGILGKLLWSKLETSDENEKGNYREQRGAGEERKASSQHQAGSEPAHRKLSSWAETDSDHTKHTQNTFMQQNYAMIIYTWNRLNLHFTDLLIFLSLSHTDTLYIICYLYLWNGWKTDSVWLITKNKFSRQAQLGNARGESELNSAEIAIT